MDPDYIEVEEIIEEFLKDNSMKERRLQLFTQIYGEGESSRVVTRRVIHIDCELAHDRLVRDYFSENHVYPLETFRRRYRMRRHIFLRIVDALSNADPYFQQRVDALGRKVLSPLQKCTAAMRMLAYGISADAFDDYVRIGESTAIECLKKCTSNAISIFVSEYLRRLNFNDVQHLLKIGEDRGLPGMMGSIDCMHWQLKNCPKTWKGMFTSGYKGVPTILLEVSY